MATSTKLPRGLTVFKRTLPSGEKSDHYYYRIRRADLGRQIVRTTGTGNKTAAERVAQSVLAAMEHARVAKTTDEFNALLDENAARRVVATLGEIVDAYLAPPKLVDEKTAKRNAGSLLLIAREVRGLDPPSWPDNPGERRAAKAAAIAAARALPSTVLGRDFAEGFQALRQGGELNLADPAPDNRTINSTVRQAKDVFCPRAMAHKFRHLRLPLERVAAFRAVPDLIPMHSGFVPIPLDQYRAMDKASRALQGTNYEMWLVHQLLRRLGLRSGELLASTGAWLEPHGDTLFFEVRHRPEEGFLMKTRSPVRPRRIPIAPDLAEHLLPRRGGGHLILPDANKTARENLIRREHNAWFKAFVPSPKRLGKGNHRLRGQIGAIIHTKHGLTAACKFLGHRSESTTEKYYSAYLRQLPTVTLDDIEPEDIAVGDGIQDVA